MLTYVEYAALVASPRALPNSLILVFQHPVRPKAKMKNNGCMMNLSPMEEAL
jgi:hypothetical protein